MSIQSYYKLPLPETFPKTKDGILIGVEVEVENLVKASRLTLGGWLSKPDGSLRKGQEFVSSPTDVNTFLEECLPVLLESTYNISPRCGTHVHFNIQDFKDPDLKNLWAFWLAIEKSVYEHCGKPRANNVFCTPITETKLWGKVPAIAGLSYIKKYKYLGMSFFRVLDLGTVEFRMFPGLISTQTSSNVYQFIPYLKSLEKLLISSKQLTLSPDNFKKELNNLCEGTIFKFNSESYLLGRSVL